MADYPVLPSTVRRFEASGYGFVLERSPFDGDHINPGPYRLGKRVDEANTYVSGILWRSESSPSAKL